MPFPRTDLFILVRNGERDLGMVIVRAKLKAVPAEAEYGKDDLRRIETVLDGFTLVLRRNPFSLRDPTIQECAALCSDVIEIEKTSEELPQHVFIDLVHVDADFAHLFRAKIAAMDRNELWRACQISSDPSFPVIVNIADVSFELTGCLRGIHIMYSIKTFIVIRLTLEKKGMPKQLANQVARDCEPLACTCATYYASYASVLLGH